MSIRGDLRLADDAVGTILHEVHSPSGRATADKIRDTELCVRVDCRPCPRVTPALLVLFNGDVFRFCPNESQNLIAPETAHLEVANVPMVVSGARAAQVLDRLYDRVPCHA